MMDDPCTVSAFFELGTERGPEHRHDAPSPCRPATMYVASLHWPRLFPSLSGGPLFV
jgi:hypothetical protein